MNYNFNLSNPFAEPVPFNLEAVQAVPQRGQPDVLDALRALGMNTGGEGDQTELLRSMIDRWAQQMEAARTAAPRPEEYVRAQRYYKDPVRAAQADMEAARAKGETPSIDAYKRINQIPELTPEEILASQGNTARNQWISMRGQQAPAAGTASINPEELRRLNAARAGSSYYVPQGRYV